MSIPPQNALVERAGLEPCRERSGGRVSGREVQDVGIEPRYEGHQGRERLKIMLGWEILRL